MNKKYIAGGLIFWAGLSGYMGLRILESYTEDAVYAALSAVPAQAGEIRYSFLSNTLSLKGVEYELPDDEIMHKGTIESVEVTGFNRKCMFVKPKMPDYDADTLPIVAESIVATGIADNIHFGNTRIEQKIADVRVNGWYQRIGLLLDLRSRHKGEPSFYEEMYRCRLDGLEINNVHSVTSSPDMPAPMSFGVEKIALSRGVAAPRGTDKVSPISLYASGLTFDNEASSGSLQRVEVQDLLLPEPKDMASLVNVAAMLETSSEKAAGETDPSAPETSPEDALADVVERLQEYYGSHLFYTLLGLQGGKISFKSSPVPVSAALNGFSHRQSMEGRGVVRDVVDLSRLQLNLPRDGEPLLVLMARYAPEGLVLNVKGDIRTGKDEVSGTGRYEVEGLGVLEGECAYSGDIAALTGMSVLSSEEDYFGAMQKVQLKKLSATYKDSGLLPMALEIFARENGGTPEEYAAMAVQMGSGLEQFPDKLVREAGKLLRALVNPAELPLSLGSTPGSRPLAQYLEKKSAAPAAPEKNAEQVKPAAPAAQ